MGDASYSSTDHLIRPTLHAPFLWLYQDSSKQTRVFTSLSLEGSDRLGFHNYAANVIYDSGIADEPSVGVGYGNYQLAPWFVSLGAGRQLSLASRRAAPPPPDVFTNVKVTDLSASLSASRTFWTTPVDFSFLALDRYEEGTGYRSPLRARFIGPAASVSYFAAESTPYGGIKRGLSASLSGSLFPLALGSRFQLADLRASLGGYLPLPLLRRHSFLLTARGRVLPGAPDGLLQVGGVSSGYLLGTISSDQDRSRSGSLILLPSGIAFTEFLRGYEDYAFRATQVGIVGARYRYPLIVDRGSASLLYLLPSFFVRQVDVEAFAEAARADGPARLHRAAGGAAFFRFTLGQALPMTLYYQFATRFDDGLGPLHLFGLSFN